MSSAYLTPSNLKEIEGLLAELREATPLHSSDRETEAARFLVEHFQQGVTLEADLRVKLTSFLAQLDTVAGTFDQSDKPAAIRNAKRLIENDTGGTKRRQMETKARHRLI